MKQATIADRAALTVTLKDMVSGDLYHLPYVKIRYQLFGRSLMWEVEPALPGMCYTGDKLVRRLLAHPDEAADFAYALSWQVFNSLQGKESNMRTLYEVFIVDLHSEDKPVLYHEYHVADSEKEATVEAAVAAKLGKARGHHFIVKEVGAVPDAKKS